MNTLGLDLSLTSTGVSYGGTTESIRPTTRGAQRLVDIRERVMAIVEGQRIQIAGIENYSYMSRNSQAHSIGELGGVIRVALFERGIPYIEIPPTCRAKFATGKGNAGKSEVVSAISAMTGIVWSGGDGDDRCDAWILEQMLLAKLNRSQYAWDDQQMSALKNVDWTGLTNV